MQQDKETLWQQFCRQTRRHQVGFVLMTLAVFLAVTSLLAQNIGAFVGGLIAVPIIGIVFIAEGSVFNDPDWSVRIPKKGKPKLE